MVTKDCKNSGDCEDRRFYKHIFVCLFSFIVLILFIILIIFLVLRPHKPKFTLQDATVYKLNFTQGYEPYHMTTTVQVTLSSHNPNNRIGVYYDKLDVYLDYKSQQITVPTAITSVYQGHNDVTVWSPFLFGVDIPVAPYLCISVTEDQTAGLVLMHVRTSGKLRWKVGSWTSGHYHIHVNCPAFMSVDGNGVYRFQQITDCTVDV
ncbi:harpin-induced like protein 11 [Zostera marina]|uniref:Harpin-induced like protein 11 n=1 Tax=Zostera marina TaxID=29655 RepID=A0A0K9PVQ4_ZOSMR|nr:harpin-induced like protein 11 [Zostera marina]